MIDVRSFAVGPIQENAYVVRSDAGAAGALMIDPGEESQRLLDATSALGVQIEAILITHCHFDHIGAVAPLARAAGVPVYCPELEVGILADITKWTMPGFGPFESWQAEHTVKGGEYLELAGMGINVVFTPGHSPGHVTYAIAPLAVGQDHGSSDSSTIAVATGPDRVSLGSSSTGNTGEPDSGDTRPVLFSGDVLFQGSVGRVDLPGGDWTTLEHSIGGLMERFERDTIVHPGHMGMTTLGREWDTNPFLRELRAATLTRAPASAYGN
jgi:hydroxyacylglutathione hydrolase